jgi:hypothetical protein
MAEESIETEIDLSKIPKPGQRQNVEKPLQSRKVADDGGGDIKSGDELEIEVVDDTPEADRGRQPRAPGTKSAVPSDDEIGQYTKGVQDRLKQMRWEYHEERRAKEEWQRQNAAAVGFAEKVHAENMRLRKLVEDGHKTMLGTSKSAADNEIAALQESLKAAHEQGDATKIAEITARMSKAAARLTNIEQATPVKFEEPPAQQQAQQRQEQQVNLTQPMQEWMDDNPWFNGRGELDREMTAYAFGVHDSLMARKVPPESPAYFKAINDKLRQKFPEYYGADDNKNDAGNNGSQTQRRTAVGSASRLNGAGANSETARARKDKVTLTASEVALAKRMRVPLEDFAREKLRLEQNNG